MGIVGKIVNKFFGGYTVPVPYFPLALTGAQLFGTVGSGGVGILSTADPSAHSVVFSAIRILADTIAKSEFAVTAVSGQRKDILDTEHPAAQVLNRPTNISKSELIYGIVEGLIANGNAYLIPESSRTLRLVDWRNITPPQRGRMFYQERKPLTGEIVTWGLDDIVHIRYRRAPDGINGIGPLAGTVLGEIAMDNQAQQYTTTMLRNFGVPGIIATPDLKDDGNTLDPVAADDIREKIDTQFSGGGKGLAMALRAAWNFFEPKGAMGRVDLRELRWVPEERILSCIGVPAAVISVGTGSEQTSVGATMETLHEVLLLDTVEPLIEKIVSQLNQQLLPLYATDRFKLVIDLSEQPALEGLEQRVLTMKMDTAVKGYEAGLLGQKESREFIGWDGPVPGDIYEEPAPESPPAGPKPSTDS